MPRFHEVSHSYTIRCTRNSIVIPTEYRLAVKAKLLAKRRVVVVVQEIDGG
jgi:hypothetical protein